MSNANRAAALRSGRRVVALRPQRQRQVDRALSATAGSSAAERQRDAEREMDEQDGEQLADHRDPADQRDRVQPHPAGRAVAESR